MPQQKINCACPKCDTIINLDIDIQKKVSPHCSPKNSRKRGKLGPQGPQGPQGLTGSGNQWFLGDGCGNPIGGTELQIPQIGDLLLNLQNCEICRYSDDQGSTNWLPTGQILNCVTCNDINNCLKALPVIDSSIEGHCNVTLVLNNLASVFGSNVSITQLVIADQIQDIPIGNFNSPTELGSLLISDWNYLSVAQSNVYIQQLIITGQTNNTNSYISFSNGSTFPISLFCDSPSNLDFGPDTHVLTCKADQIVWTQAECLGINGPDGPDGPQGFQGVTGVQGPIGSTDCDLIFDALINKIDEPGSNSCQYYGLFDENSLSFLASPIAQQFYIATALDAPTNLISSVITFTNDIEYQSALIDLNISIVDNLVKINQSLDKINRIYYFNNTMNLIASITLFPILCCPTGINGDTPILIKLPSSQSATGSHQLGWVPAHCLVDSGINLSEEVCKLPTCDDYRCCLFFDVTQPFLGNNSLLFQFPWRFNNVILFGNDVTSDYDGLINNFTDLADILSNNNWTPVFEDSPIYRFCLNSAIPILDQKANIILTDNNNVLVYCADEVDLKVSCQEIDDMGPKDFQLVMQTPQGVVLGDVTKILDSFEIHENKTSTCQTIIAVDCLLNDLIQSGIQPDWVINQLVIAGLSQTVLPDSFSTALELREILINMGWSDQKSTGSILTLTQSLSEISSVSYISIEGSNTSVTIIDLTTNCQPDCDMDQRLVLTKDDQCNYCWLSPECLRSTIVTNVMNCCTTSVTGTCTLDHIPVCDIVPKFDLKLILHDCLIELINCHFNNSGPYWIVGYKLDQSEQIVQLLENIPQPLTLENLVIAFLNLDSPWQQTDSNSEQVCLSLIGSVNLISGIYINLVGQDNQFNYSIPINDIIGQTCPDLGTESQILIKSESDEYCFVDVECLIPIIPPPLNITKELCDLKECSESTIYQICLRLDECDINKLTNIFGQSNSLEIYAYHLVNLSSSDNIIIHQNIGNAPTIENIISAFLLLGWTSPDILARPITLELLTDLNINYIAIHPTGENINSPPYPYLIPTNCTIQVDCPSNDPLNKILIKKPDGNLCWTPICPITGSKGPIGPQGFQGPMGVTGPQGQIGATGPQGFQGVTGVQGATGLSGFQGSTGLQGVTGSQGFQGPTGLIGISGQTGPQGITGSEQQINAQNIGGQAEVFINKIGDNLQFRTFVGGENINIIQNTNTLEFEVTDIFDWGNTTFIGTTGAQVSSTSSLTFQDGATLFTNTIEETNDTFGVTIDTSNDGGGTNLNPPGVLIQDGGIQFSNNLISSGLTPRNSFLEFYENGIFTVNWLDSPLGFNAGIDPYDISFQRIGNTVSLYLEGNWSGSIIAAGSAPIATDISIPLRLRPSSDITHIGFIYGLNGLNRTPSIIEIKNNGSIEIFRDLARTDFLSTDSIVYNNALMISVTITYLI